MAGGIDMALPGLIAMALRGGSTALGFGKKLAIDTAMGAAYGTVFGDPMAGAVTGGLSAIGGGLAGGLARKMGANDFITNAASMAGNIGTDVLGMNLMMPREQISASINDRVMRNPTIFDYQGE